MCIRDSTDTLSARQESVVPIGIIQTAIGGSQIEAWVPDSALSDCRNASLNSDGVSPPTRLFNGMIAPFVNTSINGWLWYQGENNCGGDPGNSMTSTGYGCLLPALIHRWRGLWAGGENASFGIVTLAAGGSEGHDQAMAAMRWSESGNYGVVPNALMPGAFLAHAYDLGDPMDNLQSPCMNQSTGLVNKTAFGPSGPCVWPAASAWNPAVLPLRDSVFNNSAPSYMGMIHPRFKHEVGRRLALAYLGANGPTLSGCSVSDSAVQIRFDKLLGDSALALMWDLSQYNMSEWGRADSSSMMVCVGKNSSVSVDSCLNDTTLWVSAPLTLANTSVPTLSIELSSLGVHSTQLLAIRYGWPISQGADNCCPSALVSRGQMPCVPGSCPIISTKSWLPANPFYAKLILGRCSCMPPQKCEG
eukprot:TRINITY_DN49962_c0_g1_i1.p1 TRINITY_DN49962_c0_g1~~TRINITY_DN49962_c0_g1_i1.p1  ORF type:complete len:417 (-),score=29.87 TRINITY_DN49962_c0_g1_i1:143-1393(-)